MVILGGGGGVVWVVVDEDELFLCGDPFVASVIYGKTHTHIHTHTNQGPRVSLLVRLKEV